MLRKFICLITALSLTCCLICNNYVFAYDNPIKAVANNFDGTSLVEQGNIALKNNIPNYRFCYAYDYDGDGLQEAYAISGIWEEGIVNGKLWFIDSDGGYNLVKEGLYCQEDLFAPELAYAGSQIFLILNQMKNERVISLVCGCRNGKAYFPTISEHVAGFHSENGHYYAYDIADYSGVEYFYDEAAGEFVSDLNMTKNIDIDYLTKYYWYYDCGDYSKYQFKKDGTYTRYRYDGSIYADGQRYSLDNNILTFHYEWGDSSWIYVDKKASNELSFLADGEKVFYAPDTGYEYIGNTYEEVPVEKEIKVVLNGEEIEFDQQPIMINDRVMVPIRAIFEAMNYEVNWNQDTKTAVAEFGNNNITVHINSKTINHTVNGVSSTYICDVMPQIVSDRIIVPVRAIAESADCTVDWDSDSMTVIITK